MPETRELAFKGIGVSPGVVSGLVLILQGGEEPLPEYAIPADDVPREMIRLEAALIETRHQLNDIQQRVRTALGGENAGIFDSHLQVVDDPVFLDEVYRDIREKRRNIEKALSEVAERYAQTLQQMEDDYLRERATDIRDVTRRILRNLMGGGKEWFAGIESPRIVVAHDIPPSEMAALDRRKILGVATELGSPTSHAAIMARAMNLPAIVGLHGICGQLKDGDHVILDGVRGRLVVNPTSDLETEYRRISRTRARIRKRLETLKKEPAVTLDGHAVELAANIEMPADVKAALAQGARGIGLFRSEYLYLAHDGSPDEELQYAAYAEVARKIRPDPVIIRTLDLGGDKLLSSDRRTEEANPFLGWRAIRLCLGQPLLFKVQLRAILRASAHNPQLRIMYPMISSAGEVDQANTILRDCMDELNEAGVAFNRKIEVGVMIEIPSAALTAELIAPKVKFFSIGTNDLVQYTLAIDRGNERVAHLYEPTHPGVLHLIRQTVLAGRTQGIWTGVCGEMAGNPLLVPLLIGLGVDELSTSPGAIPMVKDVIRHIHYAEAQDLAQTALSLARGADVLERCRTLVGRVAPEILELAE